MHGIFGLTGTPGTGKKTVAPLAAAMLGLPCVSLAELALAGGAAGRGGAYREVDTGVLRTKVLARIEGPCLLYGHMLPDVIRRGEAKMVVVLRCDPMVLKGRLTRRRYPGAKVRANLEAELIGLVSSQSMSKYGGDRVSEFDTSSSRPRATATAVARLLRRSIGRGNTVDWLTRYRSAVKLRSLFSAERTESART